MQFFSRPGVRSASSEKLSEVLKERGYVHQHTGVLEEVVDTPRTLYWGVDPSADSMHAGQLMGVLALRRFLEAGHKVIIIVGGGTGMIGDPGGKSQERNLLSDAAVRANTEALRKQFKQLFAGARFEMVNNADWLRRQNLLEFLRDIGKHFTVNEMIKRDSVRTRIEAPEASISYTEFSYMLLQAYDYFYLFENRGCTLQVGASDQWGNILSGVDLIRRKAALTAHAFCWPLLTDKSTGKKFGKSEGGAVWLDPKKTTPFQFYQFWINIGDESVEEYLLKLTLLSRSEIDAVMQEQRQNPAARAGQKRLAFEVTALVHGEREAKKVEQASEALFGGMGMMIDPTSVPTVAPGKLRDAVKDLSTSELRRLVEQGGVSILPGGGKLQSIDHELRSGDIVRIGKNRVYKVN